MEVHFAGNAECRKYALRVNDSKDSFELSVDGLLWDLPSRAQHVEYCGPDIDLVYRCRDTYWIVRRMASWNFCRCTCRSFSLCYSISQYLFDTYRTHEDQTPQYIA